MTIALLEQALVALSAPNHCVFSEPPICVDIRAALAAPATTPEKTVQEKKKEELIGAWFAEKKSALEMLDDYVKFNGINP